MSSFCLFSVFIFVFFFQLVLLVHSLVQADILLVSVGGVLSPVFFQRVSIVACFFVIVFEKQANTSKKIFMLSLVPNSSELFNADHEHQWEGLTPILVNFRWSAVFVKRYRQIADKSC